MSATTTPLHDLAHAKSMIANNPGVPLIDLLKHPFIKWTAEAKAFLENGGKNAPQQTIAEQPVQEDRAPSEFAEATKPSELVPDYSEITRSFQSLKQPGDVVELRCPGTDCGTVI